MTKNFEHLKKEHDDLKAVKDLLEDLYCYAARSNILSDVEKERFKKLNKELYELIWEKKYLLANLAEAEKITCSV